MHQLRKAGVEGIALSATVLLEGIHSCGDSTTERICWEHTGMFQRVCFEHVKVVFSKVSDFHIDHFAFLVFLRYHLCGANEILQQTGCCVCIFG